jgi:hypothetical protein
LPQNPPPFLPAGNRSCSARACHGGIAPGGKPIRQNEYTIWLTRDKHAEAYDVLVRNPLSRSIAEKLGAGSGPFTPAFEDTRCLACHTNPAAAAPAEPLSSVRQEGVSCETCHGAGPWVGEHTNSTVWRPLDADAKLRRGMILTRDLANRARVCVGCHVGAPDESGPARDVNHDLIAAGHPRLAFELTAYLDAMPAHWDQSTHADEQDLQGRARTWAVGQAELALAALRLLESRAQAESPPWPEFAEYDCFACHHDLREPSWRQKGGHGARDSGSLPWGIWSFSMLPYTLKALPPGNAPGSTEVLAMIESLKQILSTPDPGRSRAKDKAHAVAQAMAPWPGKLDRARFEPGSIMDLLRLIVADTSKDVDPCWARTTQAYLATSALYPALVKQEPMYRERQIDSFLESVQHSLTFPPDYESPAGYQPYSSEDERAVPKGLRPSPGR